jgi:hypothetical protein
MQTCILVRLFVCVCMFHRVCMQTPGHARYKCLFAFVRILRGNLLLFVPIVVKPTCRDTTTASARIQYLEWSHNHFLVLCPALETKCQRFSQTGQQVALTQEISKRRNNANRTHCKRKLFPCPDRRRSRQYIRKSSLRIREKNRSMRLFSRTFGSLLLAN